MRISIRWKLTVAFVLLAATTACVVGLFSLLLIRGYVDRKEDERQEDNEEDQVPVPQAEATLPTVREHDRQESCRTALA